MSRQLCDRPDCHDPAVTFCQYEFLCIDHAPAGSVVTR